MFYLKVQVLFMVPKYSLVDNKPFYSPWLKIESWKTERRLCFLPLTRLYFDLHLDVQHYEKISKASHHARDRVVLPERHNTVPTTVSVIYRHFLSPVPSVQSRSVSGHRTLETKIREGTLWRKGTSPQRCVRGWVSVRDGSPLSVLLSSTAIPQHPQRSAGRGAFHRMKARQRVPDFFGNPAVWISPSSWLKRVSWELRLIQFLYIYKVDLNIGVIILKKNAWSMAIKSFNHSGSPLTFRFVVRASSERDHSKKVEV